MEEMDNAIHKMSTQKPIQNKDIKCIDDPTSSWTDQSQVKKLLYEIEQLSEEEEREEGKYLDILARLGRPLVTTEVANVLIRIQEKYGVEHPYLVISRFRHALHQLPPLNHQLLHHLVHGLHRQCYKHHQRVDYSDLIISFDQDLCHNFGHNFTIPLFGCQKESKDNSKLLSKILSELISEFRAIFEIESTLEQTERSSSKPEIDHSPVEFQRKRHDGEDNCPEEIKAMKVAWDELSLDCRSTLETGRHGSPENYKRHVTSKERDLRDEKMDTTEHINIGPVYSRIDMVKTYHQPILCNNNNQDVQNDQWKHSLTQTSCTSMCLKTIPSLPSCTLCQCKRDQLQGQSEDELRNKTVQISHQEQKQDRRDSDKKSKGSASDYMLLKDNKMSNRLYILKDFHEDNSVRNMEHTRHDWGENMFEQPKKRTKRQSAKRKSRKERCDSLKENNLTKSEMLITNESSQNMKEDYKDLCVVDMTKTFDDSPNLGQRLSSSVTSSSSKGDTEECWVSQRLAHMIQVDTEKETMSSISSEIPQMFYRSIASPYLEQNQYMQSQERRHSDTSISLHVKKRKNGKQLSRQMSDVKKRLNEMDTDFHEISGYRPSQEEKMNIPDTNYFCEDESNIDRKNYGENTENINRVGVNKSINQIRETSSTIKSSMEQSRATQDRPEDLEKMSIEQVLEEKLELQDHLLEYENKHGHPDSREEKEHMKDLYQRYRAVKRLLRKLSWSRDSELVSIPEEAAISLTLASPEHRIFLSVQTTKQTTCTSVSRHDMDLPKIGEREDEQWHNMTRRDLKNIQKKVKEEKRKLKRDVKEFEERVSCKTGRKVQKEDREPFEHTYEEYKSIKSKLKLIEALLTKQKD